MEILYILMRTDLASLNPGKAVAQGAHAANMFQSKHVIPDTWFGNRNFGTTVVLGVNLHQLQEIVNFAYCAKYPTGIVVDSTYPLRDGETTHFIELTTCGYVFGLKDSLEPLLGHLELMA